MATSNKIRLVQGDTGPQLVLSVSDQATGLPIDVSASGTSVRLLFREVGSATIKAALPCYPVAGFLNPETREVEFQAPYDVPGRGGRVVMNWTPGVLDTSGEFEGELETTFPDGMIQTAYGILKFQVREQFAE